MTKKIAGIVFAMLIALMLPFAVFAEDAATSGTCGDNAVWSFDTTTETLTISGTGAMEEYKTHNNVPWKDLRYTFTTGKTSIKHIVVKNGITSISPYAFYKCIQALDVSLPEGLITIGANAFYDCNKITEINIPTTVKTIDYCAFENCESLTDITIPSSVTSLSAASFYGCEALQAINVDANNQHYMSDNGILFDKAQTNLMFYPTKHSASEYIIPTTVTTISSRVFSGNTSLTKVEIPYGVTTISQNLFSYCTNLEEVIVPDSVTNIEAWAFEGCEKLKKVNIPYGMTKIQSCTFKDCNSLESITIPDTVTEISTYAFYRCVTLKNIEIPSSVKKIWMDAFYGCINVKSITLNEGIEEIGDSCFKYCEKLESITIPATLTDIGDAAFAACSALSEIKVADANPNYTAENGVMYTKDKSVLILYPTGRTDTSYTIKSGVKRIDNSAFENCWNIQEVIIPEGVEEIGHSAFAYCHNLTDILFPNSLKKIEGYAFRNIFDGGKSYSNLERITYIGLEEDWNNVNCPDTTGIDTEDIIYSSRVSFDYATNGGTSATKDYAIVGINCEVPDISTASAVKDNDWKFVGWNTDKNAHTALTKYTVTTPIVTLYAIFKKDVTTSFYSDGKLLKEEKVTIYNNETSTVEAPVMEDKLIDAQYTDVFKGWDGNYKNITKDTSVNAVYERTVNKYTVKFMHNNETLGENSLEYGSKIGTLPTAPTIADYKFVGYFNGETAITADTVVTGNITAVAKYLSTDISIENLDVYQGEDGRYNWSIDVKCESDNIVGMLIVALYNENGELVATQLISVSENAGTNKIADSIESGEGAVNARAFLWVDMTSIKPITTAATDEV